MTKDLNILVLLSLLLRGFCLFHLTVAGKTKHPDICPDIITREQWGGRSPENIEYTIFPLDYVIIHHTVSGTCTTKSSCSELIRNIQNFHMEKPNYYGDIGYNFIIGGDGKVYEGCGWHKQGAHTYGYNKKSIGVGFIGNFNNVVPPAKQLQAAKDLLQCGVELGELNQHYKLYGAKQVSSTESPGVKLFNKIKKWPNFADPDEED